MFDPRQISEQFLVVPFRQGELQGQCFEPFVSLPVERIPWRTHRLKARKQYRIEKLTNARRVVSLLWTGNEQLKPEHPLRLFVKRARVISLLRLLGSLFRPSKSKREFKLGVQLLQRGIPASFPVLFAERRVKGLLKESCLVTLGLEGAAPFPQELAKLADPQRKIAALRELALFVRRGLEQGFQHVDCSAKHVFVEGDPSLPQAHEKMYFIDVDGGRLGIRPTRRICRKVAFQLLRSFPPEVSGMAEQKAFLEAFYGRPFEQGSVERFLQQVELMENRLSLRKRIFRTLGLVR